MQHNHFNIRLIYINLQHDYVRLRINSQSKDLGFSLIYCICTLNQILFHDQM